MVQAVLRYVYMYNRGYEGILYVEDMGYPETKVLESAMREGSGA